MDTFFNPGSVTVIGVSKRDQALKVIDRIHGQRLLQGFRGKAPLRKNLMAQTLIHLSRLGATYPEIAQIDINPLVVSDGLPVAVDANVILKS